MDFWGAGENQHADHHFFGCGKWRSRGNQSSEKTLWGREAPRRRERSGGGAGGRRCSFLRYWLSCSRLSEVFCPVSLSSWTQVVTTIARLPSSVISSSSSPLGVPVVSQPFINSLNGLRRSLEKRNIVAAAVHETIHPKASCEGIYRRGEDMSNIMAKIMKSD